METSWNSDDLKDFSSFEFPRKSQRKIFHENFKCASLANEEIFQWMLSLNDFSSTGDHEEIISSEKEEWESEKKEGRKRENIEMLDAS